MADILHRVRVKSSPNDTYRALITREGLAGWWTTDTRGNCNVGGVIKFRFDLRVISQLGRLPMTAPRAFATCGSGGAYIRRSP
jgi:hypothetical protein